MIFTPEVVGPDSRNAALRKAIAALVWNWRSGRRALGETPRFPRGTVGRAGANVLTARARRKIAGTAAIALCNGSANPKDQTK